jgi:hypothetical protein
MFIVISISEDGDNTRTITLRNEEEARRAYALEISYKPQRWVRLFKIMELLEENS